MIKKELINIQRCKGLYGKLILRLWEIDEPDRFIEWSHIYEKLGRGFSIRKQEIRELILVLRDLGLCDISPKGARLNYEVNDGL